MPKYSPIPLHSAVAGCALLLAVLPAYAAHLRHGPTAGKHKAKKAAASSHAVSTRPRAIDDARATEIQTALVKAGYLDSASGHWDDASASAMRKLQSDNGWQTKLIPDSRALIKLGLGPNIDAGAGAGGISMTGVQATHDAVSSAEVVGEQK